MKKLITGCCIVAIALSCITAYSFKRISVMNEKIVKLEEESKKVEADFNKRFNDLCRDLNLEKDRLTLVLDCDSGIYRCKELYNAALLEIQFLPSGCYDEESEKNKKAKEQRKELDAILDCIRSVSEGFQCVKMGAAGLRDLTSIFKDTVELLNDKLERCRETLKEYKKKYRPQK